MSKDRRGRQKAVMLVEARCRSNLNLQQLVAALGLREGDDVTLHAAGKRTLEVEKTPGTGELLTRLRKYRGRLPKDFKFDRLAANERR